MNTTTTNPPPSVFSVLCSLVPCTSAGGEVEAHELVTAYILTGNAGQGRDRWSMRRRFDSGGRSCSSRRSGNLDNRSGSSSSNNSKIAVIEFFFTSAGSLSPSHEAFCHWCLNPSLRLKSYLVSTDEIRTRGPCNTCMTHAAKHLRPPSRAFSVSTLILSPILSLVIAR